MEVLVGEQGTPVGQEGRLVGELGTPVGQEGTPVGQEGRLPGQEGNQSSRVDTLVDFPLTCLDCYMNIKWT